MNRIIRTSTTAAPGVIADHGATGVIRALMSVSLAALLIIAPSCRKGTPEQGPIHVTKGGTVLFSGAIGVSESGTKTAYSGVRDKEKPEIAESILWQTGDEIRIWCRECSAPTKDGYGGADHWADYTVTPDTESGSKAKIATRTGTVGLRWSEAETMPTHYFYAVSPSPRTSEKGETWSLGESSTGTPTPFTFTGIIPAAQAISGSLTETSSTEKDKTVKTTIAAPDMKNLYMVSKAKATPETGTKADEDAVFLEFRPLSTAIEFTIENAMTADDAKMQVESVKIMSDPRSESGETAKNLSGAFVADLASTWTKPEISDVPAGSGIISTYQNDYPSCTEPADKSGQSSELTINFKNTIANAPGIAKGDRLRFTFFLLPLSGPENVVNDLSFVITRKDGEGTKTIKTRLSMADGTGIPFPVHKKTYVKGILVPDSAQWTIQYTVDVTAWDQTHSEDIPFYYPDLQEITTVTSWEDVPCDPGFEKK